MATNKDSDFNSNDIKSLLNIVVNKIEVYEDKIDRLNSQVATELSVIKHQMDSFTKQFTEIQTDIKSLRNDFQNFKSIEYKVEDLIKWKNQIDQILTPSDLMLLKTKSFSQELQITQMTERLSTVKEDIKKEAISRSLMAGAGSGSIITALVQTVLYLVKHN